MVRVLNGEILGGSADAGRFRAVVAASKKERGSTSDHKGGKTHVAIINSLFVLHGPIMAGPPRAFRLSDLPVSIQ